MIQTQTVTRILRKSTPALVVAVMAIGLLASATRGHAQATMIWTDGSDNWNSTTAWQTNLLTGIDPGGLTNVTCVAVASNVTDWCIGGLAVPPSILDSALFTNTTNPKITVNLPAILDRVAFLSNAVVTIDAAANTLTPTGQFSVADSKFSTATVYWVNGTLAVTNSVGAGTGLNQVGSGTNSLGALIVTNGTVVFDGGPSSSRRGLRVGGNTSSGKLVISGPNSVVTNRIGGTASLTMNGGNSPAGSQLIITNGGKLFFTSGMFQIFSNTVTVISGANNGMYGDRLTMQGHVLAVSQMTVTNSGRLELFNKTFSSALSMTTNSQLSVIGGSSLVASGLVDTAVNSRVLVSGPSSTFSNYHDNAGTTINIGSAGTGSMLIISNGATLWNNSGTFSIGRNAAYNTGVVCGAGSKLILRGPNPTVLGTNGYLFIGTSAGGISNDLVVSDGGYLDVGGDYIKLQNGSGGGGNSLHMGGGGSMSTGVAHQVTMGGGGGQNNSVVVANAVFTCGQMQVVGDNGDNSLTVLSEGTLVFSNQYAVPGATAGTNTVLECATPRGVITINAGTINAASGSNVMTVLIGRSGVSGNSMIITNGGKLLSELGTIGGNSSYNTGIVTGAGSVWSNWTSAANLTNRLIISGSGSLNTGNNYLAVRDGGSLYNNGTLSIGTTNLSPNNTVVFGGVGAPSFIRNQGSLNIGEGGQTFGNTLVVTANATLDCDTLNVGKSGTTNNTLTLNGGTISVGFIKVRVSNTLVFAAGTLSAGGMDTDPGANGSNVFIVGDGLSVAYYDMAPGGSGYHAFSNGGVVFTNNTFLRGSGTISGTIKVLGTFVPGFSVGSIYTSNSLSFGGSAVLNYDLGASNDSVTVGADLKLDGTLNIADAGGFTTGNYTLFTYNGALSTNSTIPTIGSNPNGSLTYTINTNTPGSVILEVTSGGGDPYTSWLSTYGLTPVGNGLGTADPDGDGMINTNEFLAGFNPTNSAAYLHVITVAKSGSDMNVNYLGASGDSSGSLGPKTNVLDVTTGTPPSYTNNWVDAGQTNVLSGGTGLGQSASFVHTNGATGPARYYRVRVLVP